MKRPRMVRLLVTLAGVLALAHAVFAGAGLAWIGWAALFTLVKGVHYAALEIRARSGKLLEEERELFDSVMRANEPGQQRHLRDLIEWRDIAAGDALVMQGRPGRR